MIKETAVFPICLFVYGQNIEQDTWSLKELIATALLYILHTHL